MEAMITPAGITIPEKFKKYVAFPLDNVKCNWIKLNELDTAFEQQHPPLGLGFGPRACGHSRWYLRLELIRQQRPHQATQAEHQPEQRRRRRHSADRLSH